MFISETSKTGNYLRILKFI